MRSNSKLGILSNENQWFGSNDKDICYMQDVVHIGTKLRNRLLKPSIVLLLGKKIASVSHLKVLLNTVSKDVHGLVYSDICPDDRQNYDSLQKIMQPKVRGALSDYVIGSEGTVEYIRLCHDITSSLYENELPPLERIFRIWRATFFLRECRLFLGRSNEKCEKFEVSQNFITQNAYACIELNAKNLIILMKKLRDADMCEFFLPVLFNSQPCEETFRKMRSMGTTNFTKINFTLLELIHLIKRVEIMNDIMFFKLADFDVKFPRNKVNKSNLSTFNLPSDKEIKDCIESAMSIALEDASKFGTCISFTEINKCMLRDNNMDSKMNPENVAEFIDLELDRLHNNPIECQILKTFDIETENLNEKSVFVEVGTKTVRKSSLMWLLTESKQKLSSDRLQRVQSNSQTSLKKKSVRRKLEFVDVSRKVNVTMKMTEIQIGDWCIFNNIPSNLPTDETEFIFGNILSFRYIKGRTHKDKQFSLDFAPISHKNNQRGVEVFATWYRIDCNANLCMIRENDCFHIDIKRYATTVFNEAIQKDEAGCIVFLQKYQDSIKNEMKCLSIN